MKETASRHGSVPLLHANSINNIEIIKYFDRKDDVAAMYKIIETFYKGYHFRSRNEARWAVFFDNIRLQYRYEFEGFDLNGLRYLPDFFLTKQNWWVEVKPELPTKEEREKAIRLCIGDQKPVILLAGDVWEDVKCFSFFPLDTNMTRDNIVSAYRKHSEIGLQCISKMECFSHDKKGNLLGFDFERHFVWSHVCWAECQECKALGLLSLLGYPPFVHETSLCTCRTFYTTPRRVSEAFKAARQARF
jgi:hypothetical protein